MQTHIGNGEQKEITLSNLYIAQKRDMQSPKSPFSLSCSLPSGIYAVHINVGLINT